MKANGSHPGGGRRRNFLKGRGAQLPETSPAETLSTETSSTETSSTGVLSAETSCAESLSAESLSTETLPASPLPRVRGAAERPPSQVPKVVLITGGAGFIGTNVAARYLKAGWRVLILDNLSRPGVETNLEWLLSQFASSVRVDVADVRDTLVVHRAVASSARVYHFAAQVAVTTSLHDPLSDFEINVRGTLNVLEALRRMAHPPPMLYTSTNKVYGNLNHTPLHCNAVRYTPRENDTLQYGSSEHSPLNFHSPYGCSKGAADQYVLDYAHCYGLPTVVFRMSCIYGPHQWGNEDQGWVAHFILQALKGRPITIYGDGKQVRDVLFVADLVEAMYQALEQIEATRGRCFNIGGGPRHTCSLLELLALIEQLQGTAPDVRWSNWRTGDQRYYVSDIRAFQTATHWEPRVSVTEGVSRLYEWLAEHQQHFRREFVGQQVELIH